VITKRLRSPEKVLHVIEGLHYLQAENGGYYLKLLNALRKIQQKIGYYQPVAQK
jgi:hypothetical protein